MVIKQHLGDRSGFPSHVQVAQDTANQPSTSIHVSLHTVSSASAPEFLISNPRLENFCARSRSGVMKTVGRRSIHWPLTMILASPVRVTTARPDAASTIGSMK